jgi:hypothetical protein
MKRTVMGRIFGLSLVFGWLALVAAAQPVMGVAQEDGVGGVDCREQQFVPLPTPMVTLTTHGKSVLVSFQVRTGMVANTTFHYHLEIDGEVQDQQISASSNGVNNEMVHTFFQVYPLPKGTHTFGLVMAYSGVANALERWLTVIELNE